MRFPRLQTLLAITAIVSLGCSKHEGAQSAEQQPTANRSELTSNSGGDVRLSDGSDFDYVITSERYKAWDAAQRSLDRSVVARFGSLLNPRSPTQQSIGRATAYLEGNPATRQSIERTGMSVHDFVLMTVALEQQMQAAAHSPGMSTPMPMPLPPDLMPPTDTGITPPQPAVPATPSPTPMWRDTAVTRTPSPTPVLPRPRIDSIPARDTTPTRPVSHDSATPKPSVRDSAPKDTTTRRDTLTVKRDSLTRDL